MKSPREEGVLWGPKAVASGTKAFADAITLIGEDTIEDFDSLKDSWANNETLFKDVSFGGGTFTISQAARTITVTGTVGDAVRSHSVDSPTEADCTLIDTSNYNLSHDGDDISSITFRKICLTQITVTQMQFSWDPDGAERIERIRIESTTIYNNPAGAPSGTLLDVADYTATTGNNNVINDIEWDNDMEGKTVTMTWTFADNTTKTVTFGPLEE